MDACARKVKSRYAVWPSARASQAVAKCRKKRHIVHKSPKGAALRRWKKERWVNTKTGRPCGNEKDRTEYCRPTRKVSSKTPRLRNRRRDPANYARKKVGLRAKIVR